MQKSTISLSFSPNQARLLFQTLVIFEIFLVALYAMDQIFLMFGKTHHIIDLDGEANFPSWFSSVQLFFIGFLLFIQLFKTPQLKHISISFISLIALSFIFLSLDETIQFHEKFPFWLIPIEWLPRFKDNYGAWIPIYVTMTFTFLIVFRKIIINLWQFYRKELIIFSIGMFFFLLGGVVLEIISIEHLFVNRLSKAYLLEVAMEEGLEMIGASFMLYASLLLALH